VPGLDALVEDPLGLVVVALSLLALLALGALDLLGGYGVLQLLDALQGLCECLSDVGHC